MLSIVSDKWTGAPSVLFKQRRAHRLASIYLDGYSAAQISSREATVSRARLYLLPLQVCYAMPM
jgi:hypothetical protein